MYISVAIYDMFFNMCLMALSLSYIYCNLHIMSIIKSPAFSLSCARRPASPLRSVALRVGPGKS